MDNRNLKTMKNGYDRYQVDNLLKQYEEEIDMLRNKNNLYMNENKRLEEKYENLSNEYGELVKEVAIKERMADEVGKLAIKEANSIIQSASQNADHIIKEALASAKVILTELSYTVKITKDAKDEMRSKINEILKRIDDFESIQIPNLSWLNKFDCDDQDD